MLSVFGLGRGKSIPVDPYRILGYLPASLLPAGVHLTMDKALEVAAVWACVDAIASPIASSPLLIRARDERGRKKTLYEDPLDYIFNVRPNPDMTAIGWRETMMFCALTWGNGYSEIRRDNSGRIAALEFLFPDRVVPRRLSADQDYALYYEYTNPDGGKVMLDPADVFHIHGPGITGLMGDNVVARAAMSISVAAAQERFAASYFGNNTVIGGWLSYPKTLSNESHEAVQKDWEKSHRGPNQAHKVPILENGMEFHPHEVTAESAQITTSRQFQLQEICRWYKVPPHKIGDLSRSTNNNIEHQGIEWVRDCLTPWARRLEQEANAKLFAPRSRARWTELDMAWLKHGDAKSQAETYQIYRQNGVYSANEIREKLGENDIGPEGDVRIVPSNFQTVEQLEIAQETARKNLEAPPPVARPPPPDPSQPTNHSRGRVNGRLAA